MHICDVVWLYIPKSTIARKTHLSIDLVRIKRGTYFRVLFLRLASVENVDEYANYQGDGRESHEEILDVREIVVLAFAVGAWERNHCV